MNVVLICDQKTCVEELILGLKILIHIIRFYFVSAIAIENTSKSLIMYNI
jgi:hypothetical protein